MRELFALILLIVLVSFGWKQSFRDHVRHLRPEKTESGSKPEVSVTFIPSPAGKSSVAASTPAPARERQWMFENTNMDQPHKSTSSRAR
ncbi:MAG TPA: hypothetical protein VF593_04460 [Chthoniobacteraceae bacterium]|jgi:hypothetical protein